MKKYAILFFLLLDFTFAFSQLSFCSGSKGAPIFFEDFGSGSNYGPALGAGITNYSYVNSGFPQDGEYTLFNRTNLIPNNWLYSLDHTPDNQTNGLNGKCLIVNASNTPGQFYKKTVTNLCSNTTFEFSAWLINIYNAGSGACPGSGIPINITFEIWNATETVLLQSGNTGNINGTSNPIWNQFGLVFTMGAGQTSVILKMRNNGVGGCGNDLAIDDIMFRACGEFSQIANTGNTQNNINICQNETITNNVLTISTTGTAPNVYQWQQSTDAINYTDIAGATNTTYNFPPVASTTYYRVKVANDTSNLSNPFCSTLSEIFTVNVNPAPSPPISNGDKTLCSNQSTTITVTAGTNENINWYDAATNGNLLLSNATGFTSANAGTYYAEAINTLSGCKSSSRTAVKLLPKTTVSFTGTTTICSSETTALTLTCSDTTAILNWTATSTNATGFSNGTGNAIQQTLTATGASQGTVIYTITPTVNGCEGTTQTITVSVNMQATVTPTFSAIPTSFCKNATVPTLPTSSTNSTPIAGTWNPPIIITSAIGNTVYTFIPQPNACVNYTPTSKTITITDNVIPNFNANLTICSGTTPPLLGPTSPNGIVGTWNPTTVDNLVSKSYLFTPNGGQCAVAQTINVVINSNNSIVAIGGNTTICSTETTSLALTTADPNVTFKWKATSTNVTGFSNGTGSAIQQTLIAIGTAPGTVIYTVTPILNGCEGTPTVATVTVNTLTNITPTFSITPTTFCKNAVPPTLPTSSTNSTPIVGTWNPTAINTSSVGNTIYTFVPTPNACIKYASYTLTITILDNFLPDFEDAISFCLGANPPQLALISPVGITGTWNPSVIDNQVSSNYTFTPDGSQCALPQTINVSVFKPTLTSVTCTTSVAFSENQMITVLATDIGDYLYQLDNGVFQEDNVFSNVTAGYHKVTVMDKNGCSPSMSENVIAINYPKYFTPNGDGINDVWTIKGLSNLKNVEMTVFDRYGKAIAALTPSSLGWDGKFNGADLPSDDYWFVIHFVENNVPRTFRSHFSLKR